MGRVFVGLTDKRSETIKDRLREPMTKLQDGVDTDIQDMGIEREGRAMGAEIDQTGYEAGSSGGS